MSNNQNLSLGEFLRVERERRGITIEQVASATKISIRLLYMIEADQYGELPAKPFIRGFVGSYAKFIGLNPKEVLTEYGDFIASKTTNRPAKHKDLSGYAFERREGDQSRTLLWVIMGGFVVLGGLLIFVLKPSFRHHRPSHLEKLRVAKVLASSPHPSPSAVIIIDQGPELFASPSPGSSSSPDPSQRQLSLPVPSPNPNPSPSLSPSSLPSVVPSPKALLSPRPDPLNSGADLPASEVRLKILFKALEDIWVRFQVDNKPASRFPIRKGRILVVRAREMVKFQVSNPQYVAFNLNNKGYRVAGSDQNLVTRQKTATLIFPFERTDSIQEPFPGERPLPALAPAPYRAASPAPAPSP